MDYYYFYAGPLFAGLVLIVAAVLIIAGLTTVKPLLLKVISIIVSVTVVIVNFSITIAEYSDRRVVFFGIALLIISLFIEYPIELEESKAVVEVEPQEVEDKKE